MNDEPGAPKVAGGLFRLSQDEVLGNLPPVCVKTGQGSAVITPVRFARAPWWSAAPLIGLLLTAAVTVSLGPIASWWMVGAVILPILASQGVMARLPLSEDVRERLHNLRRRRFRLMMGALLLTWVAVSLFLFVSRLAGIVVLAGVIAMYVLAVGTYLASRLVGVGGWPEDDGGVTVKSAHPTFISAVELYRTGHLPQ